MATSSEENGKVAPADLSPFLLDAVQPVKAYLDDLLKDRLESDQAAESSRDKLIFTVLPNIMRFYERMTNGTPEADKLVDEFEEYLEASGLKFNGDTHMVAKIAGVVFNPKGQKPDRRRASAYGKVLKTALAKGIKSDGLAKFIKESGGVEKIRDGGSGMSTEAKADTVWSSIKTVEVGTVELDPSAEGQGYDATFRNKRVVLLATQQPGRKFVIHGVVKASAAVDAAFATKYNANATVSGSTVGFNAGSHTGDLDKARAEIVAAANA